MTSIFLSVGVIAAVIIEVASIRVRQVTVFLRYGFSVTGFSTALLLLALSFSATILCGTESQFAGKTEIRSNMGVCKKLCRLLLDGAVLPGTDSSPMPVG